MTNTKYIPLIIGIAIAAGILFGSKINYTDSSDKFFTTNSKKDKLNRLIDYIDYEYVEDVNTDSIVDITVNGILDNLDPHSTYISKENLKGVTESMAGSFIGIGINFYPYKDTIAVIKTIKNGPSEHAGIKPGDRILLADGDTIFGNTLTDVLITEKLRGPKNSKVKLTVFRKGEPNFLEFDVKRERIPLKSIDASYMLTSNLGYVKINRFAESTFNEFKIALSALKEKGATQLALDLRDNPGGLLGVAEQIADEFLAANKLIVFTKNKKGKIEKTYATKNGDFENGTIYILINENSASASEIIAGALQDNDKGIIVGRRSFGKGLVQREMALGDGSAIRLTVSRYYTPTGRSIQKPYNKNNNKDYYTDYTKRLRNGELYDAENITITDSLKFTTPKGKTVYGGGGIIPDVFVPIDEKFNNKTITILKRKNYFSFFVFKTLDKNRTLYNSKTQLDFVEKFEVNDTLYQKFNAFVNQKEQSNINLDYYKTEINCLLKANLAKQLFNDAAFEQIINKNDIVIQEVVALSKH